MTTVSSVPFTSLGLPEPADKMDISSPYNRNLDDFDIDVDIAPRPSDEDFILEDLRSDTGIDHQADQVGDTDDFMVDEERQSVLSEDRTMRDDDTVQDEYLTDASDTGLEENVLNETDLNGDHQSGASAAAEDNQNETVQDTENRVNDTSPEIKSTELHHVNEERNLTADNELIEDDLEADHPNEGYPEPTAANDLTDAEAGFFAEEQSADKVDESTDHAQLNNKDESKMLLGSALNHSNDVSRLTNNEDTSEISEPPETLAGNDKNRLSTNLETDIPSTSIENDVSKSPITPLHPIIIHYDGNELSLFPPSDNGSSETFLLDDENLVNVSITDLLRACRVVLGETFDEVDELVLSIEALGISLSEECLHAASTSFNDILDIYTKLRQLDGVEIEPLYVILSSKPRFSVRFQALQAAVSDGRGLSQVPFLAEDINAGLDEKVDEDSVHDGIYDANEQRQDDFEEQQPHEAITNIPSSEANIDKRVTLSTNQMPDGENGERAVSQIVHPDENSIGGGDSEGNRVDEPVEYDTATHEDLQASEYIEEDDLIIYGDGDNDGDAEEGNIDLPEHGAVKSEHPIENAENAVSDDLTSHMEPLATGTNSFHDDIHFPSKDATAEFPNTDATDHGKSEKVTNTDIPKSEPEGNDEHHSVATNNIINTDQDEHAVYHDDPSDDEIEDSYDHPQAIGPSTANKEVESVTNPADAVDKDKVRQHSPVDQDSKKSSRVDTKFTAGANAQIQAQPHEDVFLSESDASLRKESHDDPEYGESSALLETDRHSSSAEEVDNEYKEEIGGESIDTTITELPVNQSNDESITSVHHVEELRAISRKNSPSAKRLRSDDLEDSLEGEEITIDNKRIRSL